MFTRATENAGATSHMWPAGRYLPTPVQLNRPVVGKTALVLQKSQQTHYY